MTDAFDDAMADIAIKSAANGGPTTQDILTALRAGHDAALETAADLAKKTEATAEVLALELKRIVSHLESESDHTAAAMRVLTDQVGGRAEAIDAAKREVIREVESRDSWPVLDRVVAEMRAAIADICRRAPRRADDPPEYDYSGIPPRPAEDEQMGDIRRGWRVGKWIAMTLAVALLAFGISYWADACSRSHCWSTEPPITAPTVTVTATTLP